MMQTRPHERFSAEVSLDPRATSAFAHAVGDTNPVHHDAELAAKSRFGRLIASGPQTTAHLLALTASHFSKRGAMLGLEFWVQFRRPVYADETIMLEWLVVSRSNTTPASAATSSIYVAAFASKPAKPPWAPRAAYSSPKNSDDCKKGT